MSKIGEEINELLDELERDYKVFERQPGDVISSEMAEKTGLDEHRCREILLGKFKKGELTRYKVLGENGALVYAYKKCNTT